MRREELTSRKGVRDWSGGVLVGLATTLVLVSFGQVLGGEPASTMVLGEAVPVGATSRVRIELKAQGLFRPGLPAGKIADDARMPKPLAIEIETRLVFYERVLGLLEDPMAIGTDKGNPPRGPARGRSRKVARHVIQAAAAINGEIRPRATSLRPEVSLLIAERRRGDRPVIVVSPAGPLTRSELELVEVEGDPLSLTELLPSGPVGLGRSWRAGEAAVRGISGYDVITANTVEATLESFDDARARVRIQGRIEGSLQGAQGMMACDGILSFDRRMGWIDQIELNRNETRRPGPIEAGMDVKSTLTLTRQSDRAPATLSDAALAKYSLEVTPRSERLIQTRPEDKWSILHDRNWHVFWGDPRLLVLKRVEGGRVVAQCNLVVGPAAGRGRHQDPAQFREEIRRALKQRFVQYLGAGETDGDPAGGYRYKVGVQGREGNLGVVWYYFLVASPAGDQLVATFTLAEQDVQAFGDRDVEMIGTLRWKPTSTAASGR